MGKENAQTAFMKPIDREIERGFAKLKASIARLQALEHLDFQQCLDAVLSAEPKPLMENKVRQLMRWGINTSKKYGGHLWRYLYEKPTPEREDQAFLTMIHICVEHALNGREREPEAVFPEIQRWIDRRNEKRRQEKAKANVIGGPKEGVKPPSAPGES